MISFFPLRTKLLLLNSYTIWKIKWIQNVKLTAYFSTGRPVLALSYYSWCYHLHWTGNGSMFRLPSRESHDSSVLLYRENGLGGINSKSCFTEIISVLVICFWMKLCIFCKLTNTALKKKKETGTCYKCFYWFFINFTFSSTKTIILNDRTVDE